MRSRSEFFAIYSVFVAIVRTQFSTSIRIFRSDSGGSTSPTSFAPFLSPTALSHSSPALMPTLRMAPRKGNIATSLRLLALFSLLPMFLHIFGLRLFPRLSTSSTFNPPLSFRVGVPASVCSLVLLGTLIFVCSDVCVMSYYQLVSGRSSLPSPLHVFF